MSLTSLLNRASNTVMAVALIGGVGYIWGKNDAQTTYRNEGLTWQNVNMGSMIARDFTRNLRYLESPDPLEISIALTFLLSSTGRFCEASEGVRIVAKKMEPDLKQLEMDGICKTYKQELIRQSI